MLYNKSLFIFRRDLRLVDNTALNYALKNSKTVIPCFIFDPRQIFRNKFFSKNAFQFMIESLNALDKDLKKYGSKLNFFYGRPEEVVKKLLKNEAIDAIYSNKDYTPFSIMRDMALKKICIKTGKNFHHYDDVLLNAPSELVTVSGDPYSIFTPFFKKALTKPVAIPQHVVLNNFFKGNLSIETTISPHNLLKVKNRFIAIHGGRQEAQKILKSLKKFKNYSRDHDFPSIATTHLSAHNKFGTVSIREVFHAVSKKLGRNHPLIRQLYWRDFFTYVAYHSPFVFGQPYHKKYKALWWSDNKKIFKRWCEGTTGFPLVDAGMRQLNKTGFMHNRVRLVTASFLVKDLHCNWLWGERYFAQKLVDYDPAVNNGNWQWVASTGCDAQPYFRIFNPWLQQKKFDPDCTYIKKWVPELKKVPNTIIHMWFKQKEPINKYPLPIVDHDQESKRTKLLYKKARELRI